MEKAELKAELMLQEATNAHKLVLPPEVIAALFPPEQRMVVLPEAPLPTRRSRRLTVAKKCTACDDCSAAKQKKVPALAPKHPTTGQLQVRKTHKTLRIRASNM